MTSRNQVISILIHQFLQTFACLLSVWNYSWNWNHHGYPYLLPHMHSMRSPPFLWRSVKWIPIKRHYGIIICFSFTFRERSVKPCFRAKPFGFITAARFVSPLLWTSEYNIYKYARWTIFQLVIVRYFTDDIPTIILPQRGDIDIFYIPTFRTFKSAAITVFNIHNFLFNQIHAKKANIAIVRTIICNTVH